MSRYGEQDFEIIEYAQGGTLDQYLKSNGAIHDTTKIKNIVKMIVEGLEQLHGEYKVIYQDLKPENIYFRDANKTSLVLADFGISSVMKGLDEKVEVTASITDLYAAPELAHKGNRNEVMVTPAVDYFALGITMFELWLGEKPFKGVKAVMREDLITDEKVDFPIDMPDDYATIIRGLIRPQRKDRWGNEHVRKWLKGETIATDSHVSQKASTNYDPLEFSSTESATSPKELAALMEKYPDIGKTCLYDGIIKEWFKKAGNLRLYNEVQNITSQYAQDKDAGLYTAILALDPERPFKSRGGKICKTTEDIADAIMAESAYYMEDLKKPNANLYLYLAATEGSQGKEAADVFCKYFTVKEYSPKRALALVYLKLQSDGGITIGTKHYPSPEELKYEKDSVQIYLIKKAVTEKDSMLLLWLSDIYGDNLKSTDKFDNLNMLEQLFLLGLLPFLSIFGDKKTPIDYAVYNFNELSRKHGTDTVNNLIRLLYKLGADVNEHSGNGTYPLINAYDAKNDDLAKLLLELGADENQYRVYKGREVERKAKVANYQRCIAAGWYHTVGLKTDGTVVAVGGFNNGECNVSGWRNIVAVATGVGHTVGLKADGTVVAVGKVNYAPCIVSDWCDIVAISSGNSHTAIGIKANGTVVTVGDARRSKLSHWRDIVAISCGWWHIVGLEVNGRVVAVGDYNDNAHDNDHGQHNVSGWRDIVAIATGYEHTVGLKTDGTVVAVGNNKDGQCNVSDWRDIVAIAAGVCSNHTVGLKADGTVVAVGDNNGDRCNVSGWRDIVAVAAGSVHTVGLKADGTVVAVGGKGEITEWHYYGQCNVSGWRNIGPVPEEQILKWKGLCKYCGGKLGGLFTKKCKDCGKEQ